MSGPANVFDLGTHRAARSGHRVPEPWVRKSHVADEFDVSERTVERWLQAGLADEPGAVLRLSRTTVRFRVSGVERWLEGRFGSD